ncbi:MAG TPA: S4 domain-containing protein, partial [Usitatibacteraceae bacterium]|nr:S4 domain-containing protein [Usitatibacteraceae bacterium]
MVDPVGKPADYTPAGGAPPRLEFEAGPELAGERLDRALARLLPQESRSRLARLVETGAVSVDGEAGRPARRLKGGERLAIRLDP